MPAINKLDTLGYTVEFHGVETFTVPKHCLQPTQSSDNKLEWSFNNIITNRPLAIEIPGARSAMGGVTLLSRLAAIAVLLFGAGFWYLSEWNKPGQLKDFRWGHFFLLALNYSLFFIIFAIIRFQGHIGTWLAIVLSAALSLPLLFLHLTRFLNRDFALKYILPLAVFTLAIVINGVYGRTLRDYVFVAALVAVLGFVTVTFKAWAEKRTDYLADIQRQRKEKFDALCHRFYVEAGKPWAQALALDSEAARLMNLHQDVQSRASGAMIQQAHEAMKRLQGEYKQMSESLELYSKSNSLLSDPLLNEKQSSMGRFEGQLNGVMKTLEQAMADFNQELVSGRAGDDVAGVCCLACGSRVSPSRFCPECGAAQAISPACEGCGATITIASHMVCDSTEPLKLFCPQCGRAYRPVTIPVAFSTEKEAAKE